MDRVQISRAENSTFSPYTPTTPPPQSTTGAIRPVNRILAKAVDAQFGKMLIDLPGDFSRSIARARRRELPAHTPAPAPSPLSQSPASAANPTVFQTIPLEDLRYTLESIDSDQRAVTVGGRLRRDASATFVSPPQVLTAPAITHSSSPVEEILNSVSDALPNTPIMAAAVSPSSSPRLPSPPPITEVQIGPKSPTIADSTSGNQMELGGQSSNDMGASRRIRPGTKSEEISTGPPLIPLSEVSPRCYFLPCLPDY